MTAECGKQLHSMGWQWKGEWRGEQAIAGGVRCGMGGRQLQEEQAIAGGRQASDRGWLQG